MARSPVQSHPGRTPAPGLGALVANDRPVDAGKPAKLRLLLVSCFLHSPCWVSCILPVVPRSPHHSSLNHPRLRLRCEESTPPASQNTPARAVRQSMPCQM